MAGPFSTDEHLDILTREEPTMINDPAADLISRFRAVMASSEAADAQADLAETVRVAAQQLEYTNPDRDADFSAGVDWAVGELRTLADYIANDPR